MMRSQHCDTGTHHHLCHLFYAGGRCDCACHEGSDEALVDQPSSRLRLGLKLRDVEQACHTVASEIPDAHVDDQVDAVLGIIGWDQFNDNEKFIEDQLRRYSHEG